MPHSSDLVAGRRRTKGWKFCKKLSSTACFVAVSDEYDGGSKLRKAGAGRGKFLGSFGTGLT
ncbi:unnamed protein product [Prunus armeniaca]